MSTELHSCPSLLGLPGELRNRVYNFVLQDAILPQDFAVLLSCRQINHEARSLAPARRPFRITYVRRSGDYYHACSAETICKAFKKAPDGRPIELYFSDQFDQKIIPLLTLLDALPNIPQVITVGEGRLCVSEEDINDKACALVAVAASFYRSNKVAHAASVVLQVPLGASCAGTNGDEAEQVTQQFYLVFQREAKHWNWNYDLSSLIYENTSGQGHCELRYQGYGWTTGVCTLKIVFLVAPAAAMDKMRVQTLTGSKGKSRISYW